MLILFFSLLAYAVLMFSLTLNPVEVSLWLMLIFALLALFTFFFQFEFLGILLVVLYVSALIVLFIYIILLLPPTKILSKKLLDNLFSLVLSSVSSFFDCCNTKLPRALILAYASTFWPLMTWYL